LQLKKTEKKNLTTLGLAFVEKNRKFVFFFTEASQLRNCHLIMVVQHEATSHVANTDKLTQRSKQLSAALTGRKRVPI